MILLIGASTPMGKRYRAIFDYLMQPIMPADTDYTDHGVRSLAGSATHIVICTPMDVRIKYIQMLIALKKPILVDGPITKNIEDLKLLLMKASETRAPLRMMYQYSMLVDPDRIGKTYYNYYNHGSGSLVWDCMQIIALARGQCVLESTSPVWRCMINGKLIKADHMDAAYIGYVQRWLQYPAQDLEEIFRIHDKVSTSEKKGLDNG